MLLFNKLFFNSTSRQNCRYKTTSYQPLTAKAMKQLLEDRLNEPNRKALSLDFLKIKNKEYESMCQKITRLRVKMNALPLSAVAGRKVLDNKITSIKEARRAIPCRV